MGVLRLMTVFFSLLGESKPSLFDCFNSRKKICQGREMNYDLPTCQTMAYNFHDCVSLDLIHKESIDNVLNEFKLCKSCYAS